MAINIRAPRTPGLLQAFSQLGSAEALKKSRDEAASARRSQRRANQWRTVGAIGGLIISGGNPAGAAVGATAGGMIAASQGDGKVSSSEIIQSGAAVSQQRAIGRQEARQDVADERAGITFEQRQEDRLTEQAFRERQQARQDVADERAGITFEQQQQEILDERAFRGTQKDITLNDIGAVSSALGDIQTEDPQVQKNIQAQQQDLNQLSIQLQKDPTGKSAVLAKQGVANALANIEAVKTDPSVLKGSPRGALLRNPAQFRGALERQRTKTQQSAEVQQDFASRTDFISDIIPENKRAGMIGKLESIRDNKNLSPQGKINAMRKVAPVSRIETVTRPDGTDIEMLNVEGKRTILPPTKKGSVNIMNAKGRVKSISSTSKVPEGWVKLDAPMASLLRTREAAKGRAAKKVATEKPVSIPTMIGKFEADIAQRHKATARRDATGEVPPLPLGELRRQVTQKMEQEVTGLPEGRAKSNLTREIGKRNAEDEVIRIDSLPAEEAVKVFSENKEPLVQAGIDENVIDTLIAQKRKAVEKQEAKAAVEREVQTEEERVAKAERILEEKRMLEAEETGRVFIAEDASKKEINESLKLAMDDRGFTVTNLRTVPRSNKRIMVMKNQITDEFSRVTAVKQPDGTWKIQGLVPQRNTTLRVGN